MVRKNTFEPGVLEGSADNRLITAVTLISALRVDGRRAAKRFLSTLSFGLNMDQAC